jgi:hypothetical protein
MTAEGVLNVAWAVFLAGCVIAGGWALAGTLRSRWRPQ